MTDAAGASPLEILENLESFGAVGRLDAGDYATLARAAFDSDPGMDDSAKDDMFSAAVDLYVDDTWDRTLAEIGDGFAAIEDGYHGTNDAAVVAVSGVDPRVFAEAKAAKDAGDPSDMAAIRSAFLSNL